MKQPEMVLGKEHSDTLASMNNLTTVLRDQGKYEVEEIHQQALRLVETVLGKEYPSIMTSMCNLAGVLSDQGKDEEAEEMLRQTLRLAPLPYSSFNTTPFNTLVNTSVNTPA
jgi:Tfp pilus assembly protein PilF